MESQARITEWEAEFRRLEREYPERPKLVYLASCYRSAQGEHGVDKYIHEASVLARQLWKLGLVVHCGVKNTAFFSGPDVPEMCWLRGDFEIIRRCDGFVLHPNWEDSEGAKLELEVARECGLPVFFMPDNWRKLANWAKGGVTNDVCGVGA